MYVLCVYVSTRARGVCVWCVVCGVWCVVCGVVWCGVVWCGVVWCGVVWCGVVWCGVVWCGVVWCGVSILASNKMFILLVKCYLLLSVDALCD